MIDSKKRSARKLPRKKKAKIENSTIISVRVSGQEKKVLHQLAKSRSKSISELMREAVEFWRLNGLDVEFERKYR